MNRELEECRGLVAKEGAAAWVRYSETTRAKVVAYARRQVEQGASLHGVAGEVGMPSVTLSRWMRVELTATAFLPVEIGVAEREAKGWKAAVVLHGPRGLRVEGVDALFLAELILALS